MESKQPNRTIPIIPAKSQGSQYTLEGKVSVSPKIPYSGNSTVKVFFYIYHKCNARCDYCYWFRDFDFQDPMTKEVYTRVIDEVAKRENATLLLLGGEPSTSPFLPEIIEYSVAKGIKQLTVSTNFLRPTEYFMSLPCLDRFSINIAIHLDIFKDKTDAEFRMYLDRIIDFAKNKPGKPIRIGSVIDERYMPRLEFYLEYLKDLNVVTYPVLPTNGDYTYCKFTQGNVNKIKKYFSEEFYKFLVNNTEYDMFDEAIHNRPNFNGYWCNSSTIEIFTSGRVSIACDDDIIGNVLTEDDVIKNFNPLRRCKLNFCDNFNRIMLEKKKYGKYT